MTEEPGTIWISGPLQAAMCFSVSPGSVVAAGPGDSVTVTRRPRRSTIKNLDTGVKAAISMLAGRPSNWAELEHAARGQCRSADTARLALELRRLTCLGDLQLSCHHNGSERLTAVATSRLADPWFGPVPADTRLRLSRFTVGVCGDEGYVLDSPARHFRVTVQAPSLGPAIIRLAQPVTAAEFECGGPDADDGWLRQCLAFLLGLGLLERENAAPGTAEEMRNVQDVSVHARSRRGLTDLPIGGTFRFSERIAPAPAIKKTAGTAGPVVSLPKPDLARLCRTDPPLSAVTEARRSVRSYGNRPVSLEQLSEFLYRTSRVKAVMPRRPDKKRSYEGSRRPYPTGGAAYDLEVYLTAGRCEGISPAFYHYEPLSHQLRQVTDRREVVTSFLRDASHSSEGREVPHILITLAARFARGNWKYEGIAYSLTLKNVGVLMAHMYLAATAMGLAPCAIGSGDSSLFARATGLDPLEESSVGEFTLGTLPAEGTPADVPGLGVP
jgi:SagB-type dehydrogenase family enzyme